MSAAQTTPGADDNHECVIGVKVLQPKCNVCGKTARETAYEKLYRCISCKCVTYCSKSCQNQHWEVHKPRCHTLVFLRDKLALPEERYRLWMVAKHLAKQPEYEGLDFLKLIEDYQHILCIEAQANPCGSSGEFELVYKWLGLMNVDDIEQSDAWRNQFRRLAVSDVPSQGPAMGVIFHTDHTFGFVIPVPV